MNEYLSDKEQIELIKTWWKDYGRTIAIAVLLGLGLGFGWRYWHQHQIQNEAEASQLYQQALFSDESGDSTALAQNAGALSEKYPHSPYAALASLLLAKEAVAHDNLSLALEKLNWTIAQAREPRFRQIARIRAARVLIAQKQFEEALKILNTVEDKTFMPLIEQARGDVYSAQGRKAEAQKEYDASQKGLQNAGVEDPLLQMKMSKT